jgi:hypothetical protein
MTYQEALPALIEEAYGDLFKNAERLGPDKLHYKAADSNRTPLEMLIECATVPPFLAQVIRDRAMPANIGEEPHDNSGFDSVESCKAMFESVKEDLFAAIRNFPGDKLLETIETPWGTFTWRDFMAYAYWNPMYHCGQLAYIQMIHGDTAMDF